VIVHDVGYFYCPRCLEETLYRLYDEPWDENLAQCIECGHAFGYMVEAGHELADGVYQPSARVRPVLDPTVLYAGMAKLKKQVIEMLVQRHTVPVGAATVRLRKGLESTDPSERQRLLNPSLPPRRSG